MKIKSFKVLMLTIMIFALLSTSVYADGNGGKEVKKEKTQETKIIKEEKKDIEIRYPNKLKPKIPPKNSNVQSNDNNTNTGKRTDSSEARATVVENKDNANNEYPIHHNDGEENKLKDMYSADARQFITFQTKNGKTFHLIINHDEKSENVMLLTEVSEDDLLNMVEQKEKPKEIVKEKPIKEEAKPEKKEEKSSLGTYLILILVVVGALGAGYYFKVVKKKEDKELEDFEEEDDNFFSEAEETENIKKDLDEDEELL